MRQPILLSAAAIAGLVACTPAGGGSSGGAPNASASAASTVNALPSGYYRVDAKSVSDTCSPKQTSDVTRELFVSGKISPSFGPYVSVPLVVLEQARILPRMDMKLRVGETIENKHALHRGGSATATYRATLTAGRGDGFTVNVVQSWDGVEGEDGGTLGTTPLASCRAEQELRFTLVRELCPARCGMDARILPDGGVSGDCKCP